MREHVSIQIVIVIIIIQIFIVAVAPLGLARITTIIERGYRTITLRGGDLTLGYLPEGGHRQRGVIFRNPSSV